MSKWTIEKATDTFQAIVAIIAIALTVYVLSSCSRPTRFDDDYIRNQWVVLVIDSCEYVVPKCPASKRRANAIVHKANCKNCRNKKGHNQ
jgi:hypothetical protein